MLKILTQLLVFSFYFLLSNNVQAQTAGPYAEIISVQHACGGQLGSIEVQILGEADDFYYYWLHGPTDLYIDSLSAGTYTFVIEDYFGCLEEYEVEILNLEDCTIEGEVTTNGEKPCFRTITVEVFSGSTLIDENALDIYWSDSVNVGLERIVPVPPGQTSIQYCVLIEITNDTTVCCSKDTCFTINGDEACEKQSRAEVIVNEYNRAEDGTQQYVELLVLGDGTCEDSFDLRGFILDDNNGELIDGSSFVNQNTADQIGIDLGYLVFSYHDNWGAVPHGSLIVIYDEKSDKHSSIPADDFEDADTNQVYVLPANNTDYFFAKSGSWNFFEIKMDYEGGFEDPTWNLFKLTPNSDGLQVRYPDGTYCHGISSGTSIYAGELDFPLYLGAMSVKDQNCRLIGADYMLDTDFDCQTAQSNYQTPGLPNSQDNAILINSLLACQIQQLVYQVPLREDESSENLGDNELWIFPNPTKGLLFIDYRTEMPGTSRLSLFSPSGKLISLTSLVTDVGGGKWEFEFSAQLPAGLYLLDVQFPDGQRKINRVVLIK